MKRLSTFLFALAATVVALPAFADGVDVTNKLVNPNFEEGITGWTVDFTTKDNVNGYVWTTLNEHNEALGRGYLGFNDNILWLESPEGVSPNATQASQTVKGLKNGTYVFSAMASFCTRYYNDFGAKGGFIFAGDNQVEGCNYTPWFCDGQSNFQAHTTRYQVAATVTDGTLTMGFRTIDGSTTSCAEADNCELWYFGDMTEEKALLEMGKTHYTKMKSISEGIINGPITTDGIQIVKSVIDLTNEVSTAGDYCWGEDTLRVTNFMVKNDIQKMTSFINKIEYAKEVANGDYSEYVAGFQAQLKSAITLYETGVKLHSITSEMLNSYNVELDELINQVKVDELYTLNDQLYAFIYSPNEITEQNPLFGITEHPGFGDAEGQYANEQFEILEKLYETVSNALSEFEIGNISATEVMTYVNEINDVVNHCIRNANGQSEFTLPYDWIAMPSEEDPTVPNTRIKTVNNEYLKKNFWAPSYYYGQEFAAGVFRLQTPLMKLDRAYKQIVLTVTATVGNSYWQINDGPCWGVQEMYVFDKDGNEIPLTGENFSCNSMRPNGGSSLDGLVDHKICNPGTDLNQFCTDGTGVENRGNHYIIITFPEPVREVKFMFETYYEDWWLQNLVFSRMTISGYSEAEACLSSAIEKGNINYLFGLEPGSYPKDNSELKALVAEGKAMLDAATASEAEMIALAEKIEKAADELKAVKMNKPVDGKEYFISQEYGNQYIDHQGYQKHMTVLNDSILWFADADPSDKNQKWIFTSVEGDDPNDGLDWYTVQNVGTGKYMSTLITGGQAWEPTGEPIDWGENYMKLADKPTKLRLEYMDQGQIRFWCKNGDTGVYWDLQAGAHNEGYRTTDPVPYGGTSTVNPNGYGLMGVCGPVIANWWQGGLNSNCSWALHEVVNTLPATIELSEQFGNEARHFATASKTYTLTADKPCTFEDFKAFSCRDGKEISFTSAKSINAISVTFPGNWADFRFSFNNKEGVKTLTITTDAISEEKSAMERLLETYNATPKDYEEGTEIGNVKSLSAFNAAMTTAENLLENGGQDAEFEDALAALEEAIAGLETVQPQEGKTYVIVNGFDATIRTGNSVEYGIYFNDKAQAPGWAYLSPEKENYQWQFEAGAEEGTWYIKNVATGTYLGAPSRVSEILRMSETPAPYKVFSKGGTKVNVRCVANGSDENWNLYQNGWTGSYSVFGSLVINNDAAQARWYIREVGIDTSIMVVEDEMDRSAVQGIYDLTGRRVDVPSTGLYIINGQKVLIK